MSSEKDLPRERVLNIFEDLRARFSFPFQLKDEQLNMITAVLNKRHTMGILGTGFGKSITYVLPPLMLNLINSELKNIALVISPLRSLMLDQAEMLKAKGVQAVAVLRQSEMSTQQIDGIKAGEFSVVFISPESLNTDMWSSVIRQKSFRRMVCLVAIDEVHCVVQWGSEFREEYHKLSWLRAVLNKSPFLFLTATLTPAMKSEILAMFQVPSVFIVAAVPNRPNIHLTYVNHPSMKIASKLKFYIDELREKGRTARKCIIYTRVNPAGEIFEEFLDALRDNAYTQEGERMVDVFVASSSDAAKQDILATFPSTRSPIRCLIASTAFGMGVDIPDVELVIHWGASSSVLDYWQEVGRAGRDGRAARAVMFATPRTVADKRMAKDCIRSVNRQIVADGSCVRISVLKSLYLDCMDAKELAKIELKKKCTTKCDNGTCLCGFCSCCSTCQSGCPCSLGAMEGIEAALSGKRYFPH